MASSAPLAQQQCNGSDEDGVVSSTVENDRTGPEEDGSKKLEVNGVVYSVVSEDTGEETGEEEQEEFQRDMNSTDRDVEMNEDSTTAHTNYEPLGVETFDYVQEDHYETNEGTENVNEEEDGNNNKVDNGISDEEKQKEPETVSGGQDFEQLESTQSSQPISSLSSSYNPSPTAHKKGMMVSVHRELDTNYERSTDNNNVRLYHVMMM